MIRFLDTILLISFFCTLLYAQKTVINVPDYWDTSTEGTLNTAVDSVIKAGTLSSTVFKLKLYGAYVLTSPIVTPVGQTLEIVGEETGSIQETAPPMICWTSSISSDPYFRQYIFDIAGSVKMKNVSILWADRAGTRYTSTIRIGDSVTVTGGCCEFENVIFDYVQQSSSGAIQPFATHFKGFFRNCYFKNGADNHFRYYSRVVSVPYAAQGLHIDTLLFENCTFANFGYVYMQELGNYGDNIFFNHCTFYNIVMFTLESGWWWKMYVANSLFINTFMYGYIPSVPDGIAGGTISIAPMDSCHLGNGFGFKPDWSPKDGIADFTEQDRHVLFAHNAYYLDQWLIDWMWNCPDSKLYRDRGWYDDIPRPQPMFNDVTNTFFDSTDSHGNKVWPYINRTCLYDSINPLFLLPPADTALIKRFIDNKWWDSEDNPWSWKPENSYNQLWPLEENLAYTNDTLKTAGMGGFPLGDLYHWWPDKYQQWKVQKQAEDANISYWLNTGIHYQNPVMGTAKLFLQQSDSLMNTFAENAKLARVEGTDVNSEGKSRYWRYEYFWFDTSDSHNDKRYSLVGQGNQVTFDRVEPLGVGPFRIVNRWMDSDSAIARAEAAGGANLRAEYPSCTISAALFQWPAPPFITEWRIKYSFDNTSATFSIDASTGNVVSIEGKDNIVPKKFMLHQNYPNPFNPTTVISYQLPGVGSQYIVTLKVYDILGREIQILINQHQYTGDYSVKFDANNLPSGVYFYTIHAGEYSATKKFVLLK